MGRLDPIFLAEIQNNTLAYKYNSQPLKSLVNTFCGGTPAKEKLEYWNGNIYWASPKDFKEFHINKTEDTITEIGVENSSSKIAPIGSVLVVVRSGILKHTLPVAVNTVPLAINQDVKALVPKSNILTDYLGYFFIVFNDRILPRIVKHSITVQSVNTFEFERLPIPIPDLNVQQQVIDLMNAAFEEKHKKEQQAKSLLDSINSYLLSELDIVMPPEEDNTLNNRMFYAHSNIVLGGRFDPRKYTMKYQRIFAAIESSPFNKKNLREIILDDISGNWGLDEKETDKDLISCLTIRATEFDNKYNLNLDNNRTQYRKYKPHVYEKIKLFSDDILVEKSGGSDDQPIGRVAFIEKDMIENIPLVYSNFIHKIIVDQSEANPRYVFEYLRLMHNIKVTEVMQTQTNGIRNLIMGEYFRQTIILPDKDIQKRIAYKASEIRMQAKELEVDADRIIKKAKAKVDKILLEGSL